MSELERTARHLETCLKSLRLDNEVDIEIGEGDASAVVAEQHGVEILVGDAGLFDHSTFFRSIEAEGTVWQTYLNGARSGEFTDMAEAIRNAAADALKNFRYFDGESS